ncbi:MAG: DNA polymerase III subunit delta [Solirubrobacterales bacterium]
MAGPMRPAYLIAGTDAAKIDATRTRLRARAEGEGGTSALRVIEASEGRGAPRAEAVIAEIPAMSLTEARRYLLVDGVERWKGAQLREVCEALGALPDDLTVVLIARGKAPAALAKAVKGAGGEVHSFEAPSARQVPAHLVAEAREKGFTLSPQAARLLTSRMGTNLVRLSNELDRLALWAGGGTVDVGDLEAMVADTSEEAAWSLSDAILEQDPARAVEVSERLVAQGENVTGLVYAVASRLRRALEAMDRLEAGRSPKEVAGGLKGMHPYAAKMLVSRLERISPERLREAACALADLEVWCRGGAEYGDRLALTLALRRAAGAG